MGEKQASQGELLRDTLDMLILKTLKRGAMHGYAIAKSLELLSEEDLRIEEGALYPALHRLEVRGWLGSEWGLSGKKRRAKFYRLTPAGRKQLVAETDHWRRMSTAVTRIMETT